MLKINTLFTATIIGLFTSSGYAAQDLSDVRIITLSLTSNTDNEPEAALLNAADSIYAGLSALPEPDRTEKQKKMLATFDYLTKTATPDDPDAIKTINQISPKRNGTNAIVTRKTPTTIPVKGIGKRLSALRKSSRRFSLLGSLQGSNLLGSTRPGWIKYNTNDPALAAGGLLDQRLSGFVTTSAIFSSQSDTSSEAGFDGNTKQFTFGADYRINNNTFAGAAVSTVSGNIDINLGGNLNNTANTLLIYGTRSINQNWFADATASIGKRNFEMERSINFNLNNVPTNDIATSNPEGSYYGFSLGTGYDKTWNNGHSISFLASFNYSNSDINAFQEQGNSAFNLAVGKQNIVSKMLDAGVEWRQAVSTSFGVLVPQVSLKWTQEFEDKSDPINAYFIADPNNTSLNFETGNKDLGYMSILLGVTAVLPRGLAAFVQYETQQFIDDYQQSMVSLGGRKEF